MSAGVVQSRPWREISDLRGASDWTKNKENKLRLRCKKGPFDDGRSLGSNKVKILMFGPTQNGKSSLVNSMLSSMTNILNQYVLASRSERSVTRSLYSPNIQVDGTSLNFLLTDMPGIFRGQGRYAEAYIQAVLRGHIKEDVEVPEGPLNESADYYIRDPQPFDRPCCVVLVMRAGKPVDDDTKRKFQLVIDEATATGLKVAVILTHVDNFQSEWERLTALEQGAMYAFSPLFFLTGSWPSAWSSSRIRGREVRGMFHSRIVHEAVKRASKDTGIPISFIHPVVNYSREDETITEMNILHLFTLSKILDLAGEGAWVRLR